MYPPYCAYVEQASREEHVSRNTSATSQKRQSNSKEKGCEIEKKTRAYAYIYRREIWTHVSSTETHISQSACS